MFNEAELTYHRRVAKELEDNVASRDWWLWITPRLEAEDTDPGVQGIGAEVEVWLRTMDVNRPVAHAYKMTFTGAGIEVEVSAIPRGRDFRGDPTLIGNPLPTSGFFPGA